MNEQPSGGFARVRRWQLARRSAVLAAMTLSLGLGFGAAPAHAHPLNNFSANQYHALELFPDRIVDRAVIDLAEIPTLQLKTTMDADGDGGVSGIERANEGAGQCEALAQATSITVGIEILTWQIESSSLTFLPGEKGLEVTRIECTFASAAALAAPTNVQFISAYQSGQVGWREITATGRGVRMVEASVGERSVSDALRSYPDDLLASPLDQRSAVLRTEPGAGASPGLTPRLDGAGPITRALAPVNETFDDFLARDLTVPVGLAALALAIVLGSAHAAMPGHGKTVMAAYLVGRHGGARDALLVGATVTATHTGGVLVAGLLLSATAAVSGDGLLAWLGLISGALIAGIGLALLRSAWRTREGDRSTRSHGHGHGGHGHGHGHGHEHGGHGDGRTQTLEHAPPASAPFSRRGLVGLGVAGGLVPSPSALIVLLGAVALGRTWFGVGLVVGYGLGMAATLIAAGLLLVGLRDRFDGLLTSRAAGWSRRLSATAPAITAVLVIAVGAGLMLNELSRI